MLPDFLQKSGHIHDFMTDSLREHGGTFEVKSPWFVGSDMLVTSDPANVNHILSRNFANSPKGPKFRAIFELLGYGVFNVDSELWHLHRRAALSLVNHPRFSTLLETCVSEKVENGLLPVLDLHARRGDHFDLQQEAFRDAVDAVFYRHVLPERVWKLQKWLGMGKEKKHAQAWKALDQLLNSTIIKRLQEDERYAARSPTPGSSAVAAKIRHMIYWSNAGGCLDDKLVFLHAALCETLRLYPPVPLNHKVPAEMDRLPSGHRVRPGTSVILSFYAMGRREEVWGDDVLHGVLIRYRIGIGKDFEHLRAPRTKEFKPERWVLAGEGGGGRAVKHVPSYKFPAFNAGPRTCVGKDMSWVVMKMVAATVIHRYCFELAEDHPVIPKDSILLKAKHGLKVKLSFIPHNN
ncbi:unnamed protein product [Cuscuta campestris]|uniref:Cytochrome P450 n=1 Tax=Cuscuta campestris TaxID=132261 RepID=A0A484MS14_9ASTE|nr:unnamed protein product [Cuscuta campestris]